MRQQKIGQMEFAIMASKLSWFRKGSFDGNGRNIGSGIV